MFSERQGGSGAASTADIDDLRKDTILIVAVVGGITAGLVAIVIALAAIICRRLSSLNKKLDLIKISLKSMKEDMTQTNAAIDRFPKNIVQFPMTKSNMMDDDDRAGTEPASPIFYRKGFTATPLATSLQSVTEVPGENQSVHHPLQRNNAMLPVRVKQPGPPVPPKRAHSFNTHSFNY
ncbi:hypothetical protein Ocin01_11539 [Orchesella cincta]|uniref:Uncharacterized protein n=1 Tax=Orchesella cincta TaxID=48709 RepID=A0A1D2MQ03_ORCCI|nr:hypothetical protein Ocin01_11539 [Orchesella cincta]